MTKTILILAIAAAFMVGTSMSFVVSDFEAEAKNDKNNPGQPFQAILDAIAALQLSVDGIDTSGLATQSSVDDIETDLLSKKSFYEVEDIVTFVGGPDKRFDILVSLSCPGSVPAEKQAFNIETMLIQTSIDPVNGNQVAFFNSTKIDQIVAVTYTEAVSTFIGSELVSESLGITIGASDEVRFGGNAVNIDGVEEIKLKAVAIGEKPQGCDVTIDADAVHLDLPLPPL